MNKTAIQIAASHLETLLIRYAVCDPDANLLLDSLMPLIAQAKANEMKEPMDWRKIPGSYFFNERNLRQYGDLEEAYANFKIELTGGERVITEAMRPT